MEWDDQSRDCTMLVVADADWLSFELFSAAECDALLAELRDATEDQATVYGGGAQAIARSRIRRTTRLSPTPQTRDRVMHTFDALRQRLSGHFGVPLAATEEPQFLRYIPGDYFVAHQDGNTALILDDSRHRRVSLILFLSDPASYTGGDLVFHSATKVSAPAHRGSVLAFRPELTHEVTPVSSGERYTVVTWYR